MAGRRVAIEIAHIFGGVVLALVIAWGGAWAVPLASADIWRTDLVSIAVILFMSIRPLCEAAAADRAAATANEAPVNNG